MHNFKLIKLQKALRDIEAHIPDGWKWEITFWRDDGERWKVNPRGCYQESRAAVNVKITDLGSV